MKSLILINQWSDNKIHFNKHQKDSQLQQSFSNMSFKVLNNITRQPFNAANTSPTQDVKGLLNVFGMKVISLWVLSDVNEEIF